MKTFRIILAATLFAVSAVSALRAQVVADGATNTLSNVTNSFTGDVTVGTNGSFTLLILSDNSLLTNSAQGVIGRNATARANEVRLVSASARWHLGGSLQLGINGAANRLTVSNGGVVRANVGDVGILATSSNNVAMVTGSGSLWSNANELVLGFGSAGNQLAISNGAVVRNTVGYVGNDTSSSNNVAVVTDPGSLWTNGSTLNIGFNGGSGNQLHVSNWIHEGLRPVRANANRPTRFLGATFQITGSEEPAPAHADAGGFNEGWIEFERGEAGSQKGSTSLESGLKSIIE